MLVLGATHNNQFPYFTEMFLFYLPVTEKEQHHGGKNYDPSIASIWWIWVEINSQLPVM